MNLLILSRSLPGSDGTIMRTGGAISFNRITFRRTQNGIDGRAAGIEKELSIPVENTEQEITLYACILKEGQYGQINVRGPRGRGGMQWYLKPRRDHVNIGRTVLGQNETLELPEHGLFFAAI